jgi:dihydroceramidase
MPKYAFSFTIAALLSAIFIAVILSLPPAIWESWRPATCLTTGCFCEPANTASPIRQLANTISSLAFVFSGALMFLPLSKPSRLPFSYSAVMGTACIIVGVGSAFYHASLTFIGQFFDVFGMFLLAVFMLVYAFERIWNLRLITTISLFLSINIFLSGLQFAVPDTRRYVFAIVLIVALFFEAHYRRTAKPRIQAGLLRTGIGVMAIAYIIWILDNTRILCFENSLLQGHALWHLLGAVSVWFLHRYYVSETT